MRLVVSHPRRGWGGAARVARGLVAGLAARGHEVTLFCHPRGPLAAGAEGAGRVLPILRGADVPVLPALRCAYHLRRLGTEAAVCTHPLDGTFTVAGAALAGVPVAFHRPSAVLRHPGPVARRLEGRAVRVHVAPSGAARRALLEAGGAARGGEGELLRGRPVEVVPNGIEVGRFSAAAPADLGLPEDAVAVGYVGRLAREKGVDVLGRAWPSVERGHPTAHLVLVGAGGEEDEAELRRALGGSARVRWTGFRDDVPAVLAALDLVVVPSRTEAFGLAAVESMAAGLPVVATEVGGLPELVTHGREGLLVPAGAPDALGAAILELASDRERRARMGRAGARTARRYTLEAMAEGYERVLRRILEAGDR